MLTIDNPQISSCGIVYVAWGECFIEEAKNSAKSVLQHMVFPITLITNKPLNSSYPFDNVIVTNFTSTYRDKILMNKSPYDKTLFIDTDTFILGDLKQLFSLLNRFDLVYQPSAPSDHYELSGMPMHSFDEPSAGIVAWRRNERTRRFFEAWNEEYTVQEEAHGNGAWDQRSMRAAIWNTDVTIAPLSKDWQLYSFEFAIAMNTVKMVHGRGKDAAAAIAECNRFIGPRLFAPRLGVTRALNTSPADYLKLSVNAFRMFLHRFVRLTLHKSRIWKLPENKRPA